MELRKKKLLKKLALGAAAILLAAGLTTVIKDLLAMRNPLSALPEIVVRYDTANNPTILPAQHVTRVSYKWRFLTVVKEDELHPSVWENMEYAWLLPNMEMNFGFSYNCKEVTVSVARVSADGMPPREGDFVEMLLVEELPTLLPEPGEYYIRRDNTFVTPLYDGEYIYKVEASWGVRGSVLYYFKILVPEI